MYPLKFKPILKSTIWGGNKIIPFKHLDCQQEQVGESWEISDVKGDESIVANGADAGKNLTQLMNEYKEKLVGKENYERFHGEFPLLIKFIDAQQDLSIQVHPDDELAMKRHNSRGKTEMWYVIGTAEGAHLRSGLSQNITPEEYARRIADNTICDVLADYQIHAGDVFFLPAGRIHSIGRGRSLLKSRKHPTSPTASTTSTGRTKTETRANCTRNSRKMPSTIRCTKTTARTILRNRMKEWNS